MRRAFSVSVLGLAAPVALAIFGCGGGGGGTTTPPPPVTFTLSVASSGASAVAITVAPADNNSAGNGATSFSRTYNSGTSVTLTAPATSGSAKFTSWSGCTSNTTVSCSVTMTAAKSVTATYSTTTVTSVTVTPGPTSTAIIGTTMQFSANVAGTGSFDSTVSWAVLGPPGSMLSAGSIDANGLYETPYPAPATITVVATSIGDPTVSGNSVVTLNPPPTPGTAMAMSVDMGAVTRPINPFIYGWDSFIDPSTQAAVEAEEQFIDLPVNRWGGDATTRYNYLTDAWNSASDFWYQNEQNVGSFDSQFASNKANNIVTLGTMPLIGWTTLNNGNCSYSVTKYGAQQAYNPYNANCGNGVATDGSTPIANDPTDTSQQIDVTFTTGWMQYLVGKWGQAKDGGVAIYDLDNEPTWWDAVHKDVHGSQIVTAQSVPYKGPFTYDEVTQKGLQYAAAIKAVDPTAEVSGPVIDYWPAYFYSKKDLESGWGTPPCFCYNGNPVDRMAHGNVPFIEYYLQQFAANDAKNGFRSLDYVDIHGYFAANGAGFGLAGDTTQQQIRLNSTRALWDPTYTDPNYTDPNVTANAPPIAPQLIPMLKKWVAADYPGTKTLIGEYNWGGQEHINGALAQADILGIFGREGLDLGGLWGPPDPVTQIPGLMAYAAYRNYDGNHSKFGDMALTSTTADQGKLAIYGALRSSDNAVTIVIINKTYGDLPGKIALPNLTANGAAKSFLYSDANLAAIAAQPDVTITAASGANPATITQTFPAASITILVIATK